MTASQQNSPVLRFTDRQGSDFSKWGQKKLGTITEIFDGTHQTPQYVKEGVPFYSVEQVTADQFSDTKSISEECFEQENKRVKLEEGDILMTRIGSVGIAKLINWDVRASFYVSLALIKKSPNFSSQYLVQHIKSQNFQRELWKRTIHVAFPKKINLGEIGKCIVRIPSIEEQQKIASFLFSVDTKIEQLGKKKALMEQYKKGVMQKLFNQDVRFKDEQGNYYPDWEEKKLGEIGKVVTGKTPSTMNKSLWSGEIQFITPSDINDDNKYQISTERYIKQTKDIRVLPLKSIIYTCIASIGKICISVKPCATNQQINALTPSNSYDSEFIYYSLLNLTPRIKATQATTTLPIINKTEFKKINMSIPSLSEQQKIAAFLAAIDKKIELVVAQFKQAQNFKEGLLQKMFV